MYLYPSKMQLVEDWSHTVDHTDMNSFNLHTWSAGRYWMKAKKVDSEGSMIYNMIMIYNIIYIIITARQ